MRGTPQQIIDKYNQLARDAQLGNDRVAAENFQQHAEHYLRMLSEAQREMDQRREQQERENRERQAERDRERAQRQEREGNAGGEQQGKVKEPDDESTASAAEAPTEESTLVETPESKPRKQRSPRTRSGAPRKPKSERKPDSGSDTGNDESGGGNSSGNGQSPDAPAAVE